MKLDNAKDSTNNIRSKDAISQKLVMKLHKQDGLLN